MIRIGIIGLPNAGKSTLFNFLTGANALIADYAFSTVTPNKATLKLYDPDLLKLAGATNATDILYSEVEVWDIAGLVQNASLGEGLGNEFLGQIKDCNVLIHVVRVKPTDALDSTTQQINIILKEIALFDHKLLLKPFEKARRMARLYPTDAHHLATDKILTTAYYGTKDGQQLHDILSEEERTTLVDIGLISAKPRILLLNVSNDNNRQNELNVNLSDLLALISMSEAEIHALGYSNKSMYDFLSKLCQQITDKANMKRFYTVGHLGVGQWIAPLNSNAKDCAELVHTGLGDEIKTVKIASFNDFITQKSWSKLTKEGKVKKYGASYVIGDKEVVYFDNYKT